MRVLDLFHNLNIIELDVEILIDRLQRATDADVIFELDGYLVVDECLEEAGKVRSAPRIILGEFS